MGVLSDGVRMVNTVDPLGHEDGFLLTAHGLHVISHDVVESSQHAETLCNLWMHCTINIVEKIESFRDQFITIFQVTLLLKVFGLSISSKSVIKIVNVIFYILFDLK